MHGVRQADRIVVALAVEVTTGIDWCISLGRAELTRAIEILERQPLARLVEQPTAFTVCCCSFQLAPSAAATRELALACRPRVPNRW
jgi:hypothetical protein